MSPTAWSISEARLPAGEDDLDVEGWERVSVGAQFVEVDGVGFGACGVGEIDSS
jgi:hypothetical protein